MGVLFLRYATNRYYEALAAIEADSRARITPVAHHSLLKALG